MKPVLHACFVAAIVPSIVVADDLERGVEAFDMADYELAIRIFTKAIRVDPDDPAAYFYRGLSFREQKKYDQAIRDFTQAIRLDSRQPASFYNRALVYGMIGDFESALQDYEDCVRLSPENPLCYAWRAAAYEALNEFEKAEADLETTIRLQPELPFGYNNLAWMRATCPESDFREGESAVKLATKACELSRWESRFALSTLAAAYAESGKFQEAVRWQKKAIELGADDEDFVDRSSKRLSLFEKGKPFRENASDRRILTFDLH